MLKSALKKPCVGHVCNGRRVTFCETVKIYSTETLSEPLADSQNGDLELTLEDLAEEWDPFASKCLILSWQDDEDVTETLDSEQSENPEDFLVHKVFYDPADLKEVDSSNEHEDSATSNEHEPDCQPFVVHQVERSGREGDEEEDTSSDSDGAESPADYNPPSKLEMPDVNKNFCELSIKNIEQHNKLLKTDVVPCCEDSRQPLNTDNVNNTVTVTKEIGLSPPLRELGIDKLISQSADKWLLNLDISPLSSVQETDSESNLSSEDTMIMMTSEECEKNEKRIKESFQKFEWLKKQKCKENEGCEQISCINSHQNGIYMQEEVCTLSGKETNAVEEESDTTERTGEIIATDVILEGYGLQKMAEESAAHTDATIAELSEDVGKTDVENKSVVSHSRRDSTISLDTSLSDIEIPQDVREWKIEIGKAVSENSDDHDAHDDFFLVPSAGAQSFKSFDQCFEEDNVTGRDSADSHASSTNLEKVSISGGAGNNPDELELFVNQCTERVERIRKRYSLNETAVWSPRRGIRPRYGSSAEIVQRLQDGQQSVYVSSHYSWPNYMSLGHESAHLDSSFCSSSLPTDFYSFPPEVVCNTRPDISRGHVDESNKDAVYGEAPNYTPSPQHIPTSFLFTFDERGVPEGASPPRLSSESLYEAETQSDSIVYYSMKV